MEVNTADPETLLRVPGIGLILANRILASRRFAVSRPENLPALGVVVKRAQFFLTCDGRYLGGGSITSSFLRDKMLPTLRPTAQARFAAPIQTDLFENAAASPFIFH